MVIFHLLHWQMMFLSFLGHPFSLWWPLCKYNNGKRWCTFRFLQTKKGFLFSPFSLPWFKPFFILSTTTTTTTEGGEWGQKISGFVQFFFLYSRFCCCCCCCCLKVFSQLKRGNLSSSVSRCRLMLLLFKSFLSIQTRYWVVVIIISLPYFESFIF